MKATESKYCKCLYFSSQALARKIEKIAIESWKPSGISPSHAYLLMLVLVEAGIQPNAIVKQMLLSPSTISRLLEKLEEKKLIIRSVDGKITNVYATPKAKLLAPVMQQCVKKFYTTCSSLLGKAESNSLVSVMNTISDKLILK